MNITVYLGSSIGDDPDYRKEAEHLGEWIGKNGHRLVYGGSHLGLMGVLSNAVLDSGGTVTGVMPEFMIASGRAGGKSIELIRVKDMAERKKKMLELGDAFIALPGGPGTLEEISEAISGLRLRLHTRPCILLNVNGYYDPLIRMFDSMEKSGFVRPEELRYVHFAECTEDIITILAGQ